MVRERDPFGLALAQLRKTLRDGLIAPGQPLLAAELASAWKVSSTPVREALSRLAGEGLVEDRRGRGFYTPRLGAAEIDELYRLHGNYVALAMEVGATEPIEDLAMSVSPDPQGLRAGAEHFWLSLLRRAKGSVLLRAHTHLADQLALIRLFEPLVLLNCATELEQLYSAAGCSNAELLNASKDYHNRRQAECRALEIKYREASYPLNYIPIII